MNPELRRKIHASKLLNAREKWELLKYLKSQSLSVEKEAKMIEIFAKEAEIIAQAKTTAEAKNLEAVKKWNQKLMEVEQTILPQKIAKKEMEAKNEEEKDVEDILNQIENE